MMSAAKFLQNLNILSRTTNIGMNNTMESPTAMTALKPKIHSILNFRVENEVEEYLVNWECTSDKQKPTWEVESVLDPICGDILVKYWVKSLLSNSPEEKEQSVKNIFTKKLRDWASPPVQCDTPTSTETVDERIDTSEDSKRFSCYPKKRSRRPSSEMEDSILYEVERKLPKIAVPEESTSELINLLAPTTEPLPFFHKPKFEEFTDPLDLPLCEIGNIIHCRPGPNNENGYLVSWFYLSYETAKTLDLDDELLQANFYMGTEETSRKIQLQRKRCISPSSPLQPAIVIKRSIKKLSDSESDVSSTASTHPPSEFESCEDKDDDSSITGELRPVQNVEHDTETSIKEFSCQTSIEPPVCQYCQSRLNGTGRLASLRNRRDKTNTDNQERNELTEKKSRKQNKSSKTANTSTVEIKQEKEEEEDDDDDDLVSIDYEVQKILDYRINEETNVDEYRIHWRNFASIYDTWEPLSNLGGCDKFRIDFYVDFVVNQRNSESLFLKGLNAGKKPSQMRILPPVPEPVMEMLDKVARVSEGELETAYRSTKNCSKNSRWKKKKLRKMISEFIEEGHLPKVEMPAFRHQILMLDAERRKSIAFMELKKWETYLNSISRGRPEIVVENNFDLCGPPKNFKYINDNVIGAGVIFRDDPLEGCDCEDMCVRDKSQCCPGKHGKVLAYSTFKRLRVHPGYPIYECNKRCKCGPECANRVVQDGTISLLGTKLCIFRTKNDRGWGVKTLKKIRRGTFVCLYAGEIITTEAAESRGEVYENELGASYLFDLDYYAEDADGESCPYTIDATKMGNVAHFINHSCDPSLCVFNVWADCVDQNLPKLAFFALRDIEKNEELTYDYGTHDDAEPVTFTTVLNTPSKVISTSVITEESGENDDDVDSAMISVSSSPAKNRMKRAAGSSVRRPCLCRAKNCRKILF